MRLIQLIFGLSIIVSARGAPGLHMPQFAIAITRSPSRAEQMPTAGTTTTSLFAQDVTRYQSKLLEDQNKDKIKWYLPRLFMPQFAIAITRSTSSANPMPTACTTTTSLSAQDVTRYQSQHLEDQNKDKIKWYLPRLFMPQLAIAITRSTSSANPMPMAATNTASLFSQDVSRYQSKHLEDQNNDKIKWYLPRLFMPQFAPAITRPPSSLTPMPTSATTTTSLSAQDVTRYQSQHLEDQNKDKTKWNHTRLYMPQFTIVMTRPLSSANPMPTAATTTASLFALDVTRYQSKHLEDQNGDKIKWFKTRLFMPQLAIAKASPPSSANPMPTATTTTASMFARDVTRYQSKHLEDQNKDKIKWFKTRLFMPQLAIAKTSPPSSINPMPTATSLFAQDIKSYQCKHLEDQNKDKIKRYVKYICVYQSRH
jgi:nicotinamide mononucleotide adenylyltransferase